METKRNKIMIWSFIGVYFAGSIPLGLVVKYLFWKIKYPLSDSDFLLYTIMLVYLVLGCIALFLYKDVLVTECRKEKSYIILMKRILKNSLFFLTMDYIINFAYRMIVGTVNTDNQALFSGQSDLNLGLFIFFGMIQILCVPLIEETIFRYIIQNWLEAKIKSAFFSILITAFLFGVFHSGIKLELIIYIFGGILLGWIYKKTGNLFIVLCVHSINNLFTILLR